MEQRKKDGRQIARQNETRALKALHKYGWLRTRDLAALLWMPSASKPPKIFTLSPIIVSGSSVRMAQRTLRRLRSKKLVLHRPAPDGSIIYGLSIAGARHLQWLGIPASTGKDQIRRVSLSHYHHRRLSNEVAIVAQLAGYRVSTEAEIAQGAWFAGGEGIWEKLPDVAMRAGKLVWAIEIERSRRNARDYQTLLTWLDEVKSKSAPITLPGGQVLEKVVFVCETAFMSKLTEDLGNKGWTKSDISRLISTLYSLYVTEARYLIKSDA